MSHNDPQWFRDLSRIDSWSSFIYSLPKSGKDHDGWSLRPNNAVVSDGATPLADDWGKDLYHWVNTLTALFADNGQDLSKPIPEVWKESIEFVNTLYEPAAYKRTMGCSHVRFNNHTIEAYTVGDTRVIMRRTNGNFIEVADLRLGPWEERADALIAESQLTGPQAAWHNRLKVGQLDGYQVVGDDSRVGSEAVSVKIAEHEIDNIIICSDGLWRVFERDYELMFSVANHLNPKKLYDRLNKIAPVSDDLTFMRLDRN